MRPLQEAVDERRRKRMAAIDAMSPEMRALVHAYGYAVVHALMQAGVKQPRRIRHVVELILDEFSPTRGSYSKQGIRTEVLPAPPNLSSDVR